MNEQLLLDYIFFNVNHYMERDALLEMHDDKSPNNEDALIKTKY